MSELESLFSTPDDAAREYGDGLERTLEPGDEMTDDDLDEWENAGRYLPGMLYPTLRRDRD